MYKEASICCLLLLAMSCCGMESTDIVESTDSKELPLKQKLITQLAEAKKVIRPAKEDNENLRHSLRSAMVTAIQLQKLYPQDSDINSSKTIRELIKKTQKVIKDVDLKSFFYGLTDDGIDSLKEKHPKLQIFKTKRDQIAANNLVITTKKNEIKILVEQTNAKKAAAEATRQQAEKIKKEMEELANKFIELNGTANETTESMNADLHKTVKLFASIRVVEEANKLLEAQKMSCKTSLEESIKEHEKTLRALKSQLAEQEQLIKDRIGKSQTFNDMESMGNNIISLRTQIRELEEIQNREVDELNEIVKRLEPKKGWLPLW